MENNLLVKEIIEAFAFEVEFASENYHHVGDINDTFIVSFNVDNKIKKKGLIIMFLQV